MKEKRGQELSIGTLILIVLGIIVLVLLVLGFSMGWENLFGKIGIYSGNDLSTMITACKVASSSQSRVSYCEFKKVKIDNVVKEINCQFSQVENELGSSKMDGDCPADITKYYEGTNKIRGQKVATEDQIKTAEDAKKLACTDYPAEGQKKGVVVEKSKLTDGKCPTETPTDVSDKVKSLSEGSKCCLK